jgi:hypothetical protein
MWAILNLRFSQRLLWRILYSGSPIEVHLRFERTYCLHLHGRGVVLAGNQQEADGKQTQFHVWLTLRWWKWGLYVSLETSVEFNRTVRHYILERVLLAWAVICLVKGKVAGHGSSIDHCDRGFESHLEQGCLVCICVFLCLCYPVFW